MEDQIKIIDALIGSANSGLNIEQTMRAVNAWHKFVADAQENHAALEKIKAEQKLKGKKNDVG